MAINIIVKMPDGDQLHTTDESRVFLGMLDREFNLGVGDGTANSIHAMHKLTKDGQVEFKRTKFVVSLAPTNCTEVQILECIDNFNTTIQSRTDTLEWEITLLGNLAGELMKHVTAEVAKACCDAVLEQAEADEILEPEDDSE